MRHEVKEMSTLNYLGQSLKNLFSRPATENYPAKPRTYEERYRGHIENDISRCILCGNCMRHCPSSAITISKAEYTWCIRPFSCVQCNECVEVCPVKCLSMVNVPTKPGTQKSIIVNRYSSEQIAVEQERQKAIAERIAKAKAAAAAKSPNPVADTAQASKENKSCV